MPYLSVMTHHCRNRELTVQMVARYDLDAEHVSFITGSGKTTNKVQGIIEAANERLEQAAVDHSGGAFAAAKTDDAESADSGSNEADGGDSGTLAAFGGSDGGTDDDEGSSDDGTSDDAADVEDRAEEAEADDGQAGLSDFM